MNKPFAKTLAIFCAAVFLCAGYGAPKRSSAQSPSSETFRYGTTIEKERPELNEETKRLIAAYRQNPTQANKNALKRQIEINYDNVIARKKAKLEELKRTAKHQSKVREMEEIVDEVVKDRDNRVEQSLRRFTDPRLRPDSRKSKDGYLAVLGAAQNVSIAYTPVTNEEYAAFVKETKSPAPKGWANGVYPAGKGKHPVTNVSYDDAVVYAKWLSDKDGTATYRLPTQEEWELAAGHMPKDADFNNGGRNGTTPVDAYKKTLSAAGAIDMWGNCYEWTSTPLSSRNDLIVKGGSFKSDRMRCRTEERGESRKASGVYDDTGFRLIREK